MRSYPSTPRNSSSLRTDFCHTKAWRHTLGTDFKQQRLATSVFCLVGSRVSDALGRQSPASTPIELFFDLYPFTTLLFAPRFQALDLYSRSSSTGYLCFPFHLETIYTIPYDRTSIPHFQ
ncbi:hypothetical protein HGRIS_009244 [Hohenbuehelia grisea]|uniref:Uncharacterized protein n=1 Tax=Hohenbuehelia grisea TaxID=104357 RepID=A0ABR3J0W8_9AGAR